MRTAGRTQAQPLSPPEPAMPALSQIARTLFPGEQPRRGRRRDTRRLPMLSQLAAIACTLVPLGAVLQAWSLVTY